MNKAIVILLVILGAMSCTKISTIDPRLENELGWSVICHAPSTKAVSTMESSDNFASCVWQLNSGTWAANKASALLLDRRSNSDISGITGTVSYHADLLKWRIANSARTTDAKINWPATGSLNFLSFTARNISGASPSAYSISNLSTAQKAKLSPQKEGLVINDWNSDTDGSIDLLVANMQVDRTIPTDYLSLSGVQTEFHHLLAKVSFEFLKSDQAIHFDGDPDNTIITITSARLQGYWAQGSLQSGGTASERWTFGAANSTTVKNKTLIGSSQVMSDVPRSYEALYIPQDMNDSNRTTAPEMKLVINYTVKLGAAAATAKTATITLNKGGASRWEAGRSYRLAVKIGAKLAPIEFNAETSPWLDGSEDLANGGVFEI